MQSQNCTDTIQVSAARPQIDWRSWAAQGFDLLKRDGLALAGLVRTWSDRTRSRREMAVLDDRQLKDIGLSSLQARAEAAKPFWKA